MAKRYSKYHVDNSAKAKKNRTVYDEHLNKELVFDSNIEKKFYDEVIIPGYSSGDIIDYDCQKRYVLQEKFKYKDQNIRAIDYIADYWIKYADGHEEIKDTKGAGFLVDSVAKIKRKLFYSRYPELDFEWITWSKDTGWMNWDVFTKMKRAAKKGIKGN